jgi:hypothetical protein
MVGCPLCEKSEPGWVCEDHVDMPFQHDGCGGAGAPCECNPAAVVVWKKAYTEANEARHSST